MIKSKIFTLLLLGFMATTYGQSVVYGTVSDENGSPIEGADVFIDGTDYYYMTMDDGKYELEVDPGEYIIVFSTLGFDEKKVNAIVSTNETIEYNVSLVAQSNDNVSLELEGIVVEADKKGGKGNEAAALAEQRKADVIIETISGGEISRKGISDAGEAVKSVVGISKEEGSSNVYVRGLSDRYQNTTFNGLPIPSNNPDKKNINLDVFNSNVIEGVSVSKTHNPKFSGDFAAGNIDINSKQHSGKPQLSIGLSGGGNTTAMGEDFVRNEGTGFWGYYGRYSHNPYNIVAQHGVDPEDAGSPINLGFSGAAGNTFHLGETDKLSVLLTGSFSNSFAIQEGIDGTYSASKDTYFNDAKKYKYNTSTTAMANLSYETKGTELSFVSLFINDSSDETGYYGMNGEGYDSDLGDDGGYLKLNYEFEQTRLFVNQLLGKHDVAPRLELDWGITYNNVLTNMPDRKRFTILDWTKTGTSFNDNVKFDNQRFFQDIDDEQVASRFEFTYKLSDENEHNGSKLKIGYNGNYKKRNFESIRYGIYNIDESNFTFDETNIANLNQIFNLQNFLNNFDNSTTNAFDYYVLNSLSDNYLGDDVDERVNLPGLPDNVYNARLMSYAPYVALELRPNDKWLIIPGVRMEYFDQNIKYETISTSGTAEFSQWEFLPSLNVKFSPQKRMNFRLAGSRTVSLPEFKEMAPFLFEGVTKSVSGNPDLINPDNITAGSTGKKLSEIYNFDLKYEWFPKRGELFSVALFGKVIKAPVNLVLAEDAANVYSYFRTGDQATVLGIEIEAEKKIITFSNGDLSLGSNVAFSQTRQDLFSSISGYKIANFDRDSDKLQGASPVIVNADISYNADYGNYETTLTLAGNYFSDRIFALGSSGRGNQIEKGIPTLNFVWMNKIGKHLELNASAKNLLNPTVEIEQENTNDGTVTVESYKKGLGLGLSLKYNF